MPISSGSNCVELGEAFAARFFTLRLLALIGLIVLPVLLGMFLGAPVVARELEQGTHQLIWTQGASRRRWAVTKFAVLGGIVVLAGALLAVGIDLWFGPLNEATGQRFTWLIFDQQGAVLAGYALFAFALGVLAGAVTRRTLRAMGIALLIFCLVRFGVAVWIRPHLAAQSERSYPVVATTMPNRLVGDWIIGGGGPGVGGSTTPTAGRYRAARRSASPSGPRNAWPSTAEAHTTSRSTSRPPGSGRSRPSRR